MKWCEYYAVTGEILTVGGGPDDLDANSFSHFSNTVILNVDANTEMTTHYVSSGNVTLRPDLDSLCTLTNSGNVWLANGSDTISYGTSLPNPTQYFLVTPDPEIPPQTGNITTGEITLTTVTSGDYILTLNAFPYQEKILTLTAT